jgi:adenylate cyclase
MHAPPRILIVDDNATNRDILAARLNAQGYQLTQAADGEQALAAAAETNPDLILLDIMMPKVDGLEVCRRLKTNPHTRFIPIILITARSSTKDVVEGLEAGADEYLTKPVDQGALVARVKSVLRLKELHEQVRSQADQLSEWNKVLERRVAEQVNQIDGMNRLRRFLSPQIAELVVSSGKENLLRSHRREISVVFCDLRGFTAFSETAEPEEVMKVLQEYHDGLGVLVDKFEGTVERFMGDGLLVFFNDPVPCPDPCLRAVRMAIEMRDCMQALIDTWHRYGHDLGFGIGIAHGYATIGRVGYEGRLDYSAIGTVVNLAARLCGEATHNQILIDTKVQAAIEGIVPTDDVGELKLKGFHKSVRAFNVRETASA